MSDFELSPVPTGDVWGDVGAMHTKFGFSPAPGNEIDRKHLQHRISFLYEELGETQNAFNLNNAPELIDGLIDLIVVAAGTLDLLGVNSRDAWIEVMKANMAKEVGTKETRPDSGGRDLIKPEGWKAPDMGRFVNALVVDALLDTRSRDEPHDIGDCPESKEKGLCDNCLATYAKTWPKEAVTQKRRPALDILQECIDLMAAKSDDYCFPGSTVKPADYYPRGIDSLLETIDCSKQLRQTSILDKMRAGIPVNFEGLEDTLKDRINYLAIAIEWVRGDMDGMEPGRDIFNRPTEVADDSSASS